jgi:thioredoxin-dependent peroxiredoxin
MSLRIGDDAPNFTAQTTEGEIDFHQWLGNSWGIIYSHPADFTPVCTTELGRTAQLKDDFAARGTKVLAVSVDELQSHHDWIKDINETQNCDVDFPIIADDVDFPIIADSDRKVATLYNMIHPNASTSATVRSVYFIGLDKKIKAIITYPASTGRNFFEILRVIDSLQLTAQYSVATPVDWQPGEDVIISPAVKQEEVAARFPKGHQVIKPYLRYTPQPNK